MSVTMLVPGFTAQELPVQLSNLNNLRFAPDGRLTALGYDGRIHILRDTNGDGLEDRAEIFWDKPTLSVPVGMAWSTHGLYVSAKGKVSLLRDTDRDGRGDAEEIIASGWPETDVGSGGVDATAVTLDAEGNVYFGLLVADYSNAYRLRKRKELKPEEKAWLAARGQPAEGEPDEEVSLYDINSPRGTIQKWNARTKKLETLATGVRVPYALAFNRTGDLFLTDQEGETWMPHGNPLDELNHIIPGRNYGFPPRHPKWLPDLVSEAPVVAFGPQHQSTCGLVFNEPQAKRNPKSEIRNPRLTALPISPGQGLFGPKWWAGDALVAGESRGKIWRVRLVKTPHGYVGRKTIIARLSMLTTDLAISPDGALYVSCHSGGPDWGTGPNGPGKIFKITYSDPTAPQPVLAWVDSPTEVRVAFDKPLDPNITNGLLSKTIEFGEYVSAADRFELLKPPYRVVQDQEAAPRGKLRIISARLDDRGQTLTITTEAHTVPATYALTIPNVRGRRGKKQSETVDIDYDLSGVTAWVSQRPSLNRVPFASKLPDLLNSPNANTYLWSAWIPSPTLVVSERLLDPVGLRQNLSKAARIGKGDSFNVYFSLDLPPKGLVLVARASSRVDMTIAKSDAKLAVNGTPPSGVVFGRDPNGRFTAKADFSNDFLRNSLPGIVHISVRDGATDVEVLHSTADNSRLRPLPLSSGRVGWFPAFATNSLTVPVLSTDLRVPVGDWEAGHKLFFSETLQCARCHRVRHEGGTIGPDLSNLVYRDIPSVLRDIRDPNAAINPDYVSYNVTRTDGEQFTGFIRAHEVDRLRVTGADGKETVVARTELKDFAPSPVSLMPAGLLDALSTNQVADLLTFLVTEPAKVAPSKVEPAKEAKAAPPPRKRSEVEAALAASQASNSTAASRPLDLVLVASKQDHGPGEHDYPWWQTNWSNLLGQAEKVRVSTAWEWPSESQLDHANVLVFYFWNHDWAAKRYAQLDQFLARGGGLVMLHAACIADQDPEPLAERLGLSAQPVRTKYRHGPVDLKLVASRDHPITRGLPTRIHFVDETYWPMIGEMNRVEVLATAEEEGKAWPMIWRFTKGQGRVFGSILGHYSWTFDDPLFRVLVLRGLAWAAGESTARFDSLATFGLKIEE
ncbi:MAG: ThuA domain-containing protein [Verrucomicrobiales bacterium]|nr:ThuA domain-containing protein [Verrucomicrobiales bacterium]